MATYQVFVTLSTEDSVFVKAGSEEEAIALVKGGNVKFNIVPITRTSGYILNWDDIVVYEAVGGEE